MTKQGTLKPYTYVKGTHIEDGEVIHTPGYESKKFQLVFRGTWLSLFLDSIWHKVAIPGADMSIFENGVRLG